MARFEFEEWGRQSRNTQRCKVRIEESPVQRKNSSAAYEIERLNDEMRQSLSVWSVGSAGSSDSESDVEVEEEEVDHEEEPGEEGEHVDVHLDRHWSALISSGGPLLFVR